jgi:hypothetical protein
MTKSTYIYDLEVFPNLFTATFKEFNKDNIRRFVVWYNPLEPDESTNELPEHLMFMRKEVRRVIGYYNKDYDDLIENFLIYNREILGRSTPRRITQDIKTLSNKITSLQDAKRARERALKEKESEAKRIGKMLKKETPYKRGVLQDLILHQEPVQGEEHTLDKALIGEVKSLSSAAFFSSMDMFRMFATIERTGLKQVAIKLKWHRVQDLPFPIDYIIQTQREVDIVLDYNLNDVLITEELLNKRSEEFRLRVDLSKRYHINVLDNNDTDIGKAILTKYYLEETGMKPSQFKKGRSYYSYVDLKDCISKRIQVRSRESEKVYKTLRKIRVDLTKKETEKQFELIYRSKYLTHTIGMGGIHSVNPPEIIEEDNCHLFLDVDVKGYYSSIIVVDRLYPRHLGPVFTKVYKEKIHIPKQLAGDQDETVAAGLKIASLSIYGLTKSETSPFYDPKMTTTVCVSGELYFVMLIEAIETLTHAMVVYSNTDGLRIRIPRDEYYDVLRVCKLWETYTGFALSYKRLKKLVVRDVNNFMLFSYDDKKPVVSKGDFLVDRKLSKGYDNPVVALALNRYYEQGISIDDTINNCSDLFMYMKAQRVDTDKFFVRLDKKDGKTVNLQNNNRWVVTTGHPDEGKLYKVHKDGKNAGKIEELQKGYFVTVVNDLPEGEGMMPDNQYINYSFYINETLKITNLLKPSLNQPYTSQITTQLKMEL